MTKTEAEQLVEKHGSQRKAADAIGVSRKAIRYALEHAESGTSKRQCSSAGARTLSDFRREHDQSWKIRDGLKRLFGGGIIMTDGEFRDAVCGNPTRWRVAAEASEFRENRYRVQGELLWATKETIREMRKIRGEAL